MLPTALSDHLCSLAPRVDRLCFAADMVVSRNGALKSARFYPAVMRSAARLTYTPRQRGAVRGAAGSARRSSAPLLERLTVLVDVYRALHKARARRGALDFDAAEAEFVIDAGERVRAIELRARNDAHRLIEECMILANVAVAQELREDPHRRRSTACTALLRTRSSSGSPRRSRRSASMRAFRRPSPRAICRRSRGGWAIASERAFVESLVVRAMPQAVYQPTNIGHFGLALTHYAHFTSPIRRYPDLIVHRTLKALIGGGRRRRSRYDAPRSARSARAPRGSRSAPTRPTATCQGSSSAPISRSASGRRFQGLITTVVEFGCFVQILDVAVDGLLHIDSLRDDEYVMEDDGHGWRGRRSGRRLRTGAPRARGGHGREPHRGADRSGARRGG